MGGRGASSSSSIRAYDGKIQLQSVGQVDARKTSNLKVGDIIMYNFGSTAKITKIEPSKTGKTFNVTTKSSETIRNRLALLRLKQRIIKNKDY